MLVRTDTDKEALIKALNDANMIDYDGITLKLGDGRLVDVRDFIHVGDEFKENMWGPLSKRENAPGTEPVNPHPQENQNL